MECIDSFVRAVSEVTVQEPTNMEPLHTVVDSLSEKAIGESGLYGLNTLDRAAKHIHYG